MNIPVDDTFQGAYDPSPVDFGNIAETTSTITTLLEIAGGTLPYTIVTVGFVGGAPAAGVSLTLTTTDVTDDTVAMTTTAATPLGPLSGTIRARVDDAASRSIQVDVDFDFVATELFTNISDFLDSLTITHRWKCDDVSGPVLDSGAGTTRDLTVVGSMNFEQGGPDASTESISKSGTSWLRNTVGGWDTAASGTVLAFVRNPGTNGVIASNNNSVNEVNQIQFTRNPIGEVSPTSRVGFTAIETSFIADRRVFEGDTDVDSHNADNLWHLYAWVQEDLGTLPRIYIDGVEETGVFSTPTGGSPPPIDVWTAGLTDANSRAVLMNGRFATGSGNYTGRMSEVCVLNGVLLDSTQLTALFDLITN